METALRSGRTIQETRIYRANCAPTDIPLQIPNPRYNKALTAIFVGSLEVFLMILVNFKLEGEFICEFMKRGFLKVPKS
jgi:hypothetical protein